MNSLILAVLTSLATFISAAPGEYGGHSGIVVSGPSGIVTDHGAIGPAGLGFGGLGHGGFGGFAGHGFGLGFGGFGGYSGYDGYGGAFGGHGIVVQGPATVPATIVGPAGKIVADGLYGVPSHGHGW